MENERINKIARLVRKLTFSEMSQLADELGRLCVDGETEETLDHRLDEHDLRDTLIYWAENR